jgi:hypothetical protein
VIGKLSLPMGGHSRGRTLQVGADGARNSLVWQCVERAIQRGGKFRDDLLNLRLCYLEWRSDQYMVAGLAVTR